MKKTFTLCLILILSLTCNFTKAQKHAKTPFPFVSADEDGEIGVWASVEDNDSMCRINWWTSYYPFIIEYNDESAEDFVLWYAPGSVNAVRFTPSAYPINVVGGEVYVGDGSFPGPFLGSRFQMAVYDNDGPDGFPGTLLDSITVTVNNYGWVEFNFAEPYAQIPDGDFYLGMIQTAPAPNAAPLGVDMTDPVYKRSYSKFLENDWMLSVYQDFMMIAWIAPPGAPLPDYDYYKLDRFSNFDPEGSPLLGDTTTIDTVSIIHSYNDTLWSGLAAGWYAYGLKTHSPDSGWSDYYVSNIVAHQMIQNLAIDVQVCDQSWPESIHISLTGLDYPYQTYDQSGTDSVNLEVYKGTYDVSVTAHGNHDYSLSGLQIINDTVLNISLTCSEFPISNLRFDSDSSLASWDAPQITVLEQEFEAPGFPPPGWQSESLGAGWFRTSDGSGGGWNIPEWDSFYACTNNLLAGAENNGSEDLLMSPLLNLSFANNYFLSFDTYFDSSGGQTARVEYTFDGGMFTYPLSEIDSSAGWNHVNLDLSNHSGPGKAPLNFIFHSDDMGSEGSGWAVDNVRIYSPNTPDSLIDYYIYLDDSLVMVSDTTSAIIEGLVPGIDYNLCVSAHYPSGLSELNCISINTMSIPESVQKNPVKIYPNPAKDKLFIESSSLIKTIKIYDFRGKILLNSIPETTSTFIYINNLPAGMCFLEINTSKGLQYEKFIILR